MLYYVCKYIGNKWLHELKDALWVTYDMNSGPNTTLNKPIQEFDMSDLDNMKKKRSISDNEQVKT